MSGACEKVKEIQRVCDKCGEGLLTTVVYVTKLACGVIETNCENAQLTDNLLGIN